MTATTSESAARLLELHRASGHVFTAGGIGSFVIDEGPRNGEAVVCVHGVPASAYLYRKVVRALAARGLRGIAVDLPGLGLAERPVDADYSWTGLGRWLGCAIDALGLDRFHLVVHDIGGPIGFEVAAADPRRVRPLTLLNTSVAVESFHRPWVMEPFAHPILGQAWLKSMRLPGVFVAWRRYGVQAQMAAGLDHAVLLPGKHFLQEDSPEEIADAIHQLARRAETENTATR